MSDDEEEAGRLQIDESPPLEVQVPSGSEEKKENLEKAGDLNLNLNSNPEPSKEDGELEEDTDSDKEKVLEIDEEEPKEPEKEKTPEPVAPPTSSSSSSKSSEMRPPQSTEKTRKRKESMENHRSTMDSPSTPQRSKRASSHSAAAAITACFTDDDIVSVPPMSMSSASSSAKRQRLENGHKASRDASTSVITTRSCDTSGLLSNENIMDTPPGTTRLMELTVMYRTRNSLTIKVNGTDIVGFLSAGLPEAPGTSKKKNEEPKDGRSSSASSNGRSTRGGSVVENKEKGKSKRRKEEVEEDGDEESTHSDESKLELVEVDLDQLHDCHFANCHKRFRQSAELEYHIAKNHKNRVLVFESICTQTDISTSSGSVDVAIETDDVTGVQNMPVLEMEAAEPASKASLVYEDLSDDEPPPPAELIKPSSAAVALQNLAQTTSAIGQPTPAALQLQQRSATSTPTRGNLPVEKRKQQVQQVPQKSAFSPRTSQPSSSGPMIMPSSSPQILPMQSFLPAGYQAMLNPQLMMNPQIASLISQQQQLQQQQMRTPSRQMPDSHKIHELAKAKENEQRQRQAAVGTPKTPTSGTATPQRQFAHPHLMQGAPTSLQQQQAMQQQQQSFQHQLQMQHALRGGMMPQQDLMMMMLNSGFAGFPGTPQQPPPQPPK